MGEYSEAFVALDVAITATGSDAALFGGSASSPVAQPTPHDVTETVEALIATG